jgi:hypothetical protein
MPTSLAAALGGSSSVDADAAAAQLLAEAQVAYLFTPLQQQQEGMGVSWQAIQIMAEGLKPVSSVFGTDACGSGSSSSGALASAAAVAALPDHMTASHVLQAEQQLQDRVLIAGHSSMMYRCTSIDSSITPSTPGEFNWSTAAAAEATTGAGDHTAELAAATGQQHGHEQFTANSHAEYFEKRYNVTGLRADLPMLQVAGQGWRKGLGLLGYPFKSPQLQNAAGRAALAAPEDLTTPEAASAAMAFSSLQQQQQQLVWQLGKQGEQSVSPGSKRPFALVAGDNSNAAGSAASNHGVLAFPAAAADTAAAMEIDGSPNADHQQQQQAYLPLELCWLLPLTASQWSQLQLLPAFMHRINSLLRANKMQQQLASIAGNSPPGHSASFPSSVAPGGVINSSSSSGVGGFPVPPLPLLVVSLTGAAAGEAYDLEGLEFLGDVVLKFLATNFVLQVRTLV